MFTTEDTRFCTFTAATLGSVPKSKTIWMEASPSLPASEVIYFIPGTPFSPLSSGIITDLINSSLFAPGYSAVIFTLGGEIDGNCVTGSFTSDSIPKNTIINEITIDRTGLRMNFLNILLHFRAPYSAFNFNDLITFNGSWNFTFSF